MISVRPLPPAFGPSPETTLPSQRIHRGLRVLVTGAGGPAGISVLRELHRLGCLTIAVDASEWATGLRLADHHLVLPRGDDPTFVAALAQAAKLQRADVVIATVSEELLVLATDEAQEQFSATGCRLWLPSQRSISRCVDKLTWGTELRRHGVPVAHTASATDIRSIEEIPGPWIVKPRSGSGSRGVVIIDERCELNTFSTNATLIVQHRAVGREFTVDVLRDQFDRAAGVARWRLETKAGISTKGETFHHQGVEQAALAAVRAVDLVGPANVQGVLTAEDEVVLFEANPRFSGGLPLSLAAGADLVGQYLHAASGSPIDLEALQYTPGRRMLRYFAEIFE